MFALAVMTEAMHNLVSKVLPFEPLMTRAEVCKVGYTHFMSMTGPRNALGYDPIVPFDEAVKRLQADLAPRVASKQARDWALWSRLLLILLLIFVSYFLLF